jgi:hypothetical protein
LLGRDLIAEALSTETLAAITDAPGFSAAARGFALRRAAVLAETPPEIRWLTRDLASTGIFYAALVRDAVFGGATVAGLWQSAQLEGRCSRGRVYAWVDRAIGSGLMRIVAGPQRWTDRRLLLDSRLPKEGFRRVAADCASFAGFAPELGAISEAPGELALSTYLRVMLEIAVAHPHVVGGEQRPIGRLLDADGGMQLLMHLVGREASPHSILIGATPFSYAACSRHAGISRLQVRRLVRVAEDAGLLRLEPRGWLTPEPELLGDLGWVLAVNLQVLRLTAQALGGNTSGALTEAAGQSEQSPSAQA